MLQGRGGGGHLLNATGKGGGGGGHLLSATGRGGGGHLLSVISWYSLFSLVVIKEGDPEVVRSS